jgi:2-oxoisovalerate dehydrogenase E1 component beta subunit
VARHTGKVLVVHEDSRTGGIGESLAAIIQEEASNISTPRCA